MLSRLSVLPVRLRDSTPESSIWQDHLVDTSILILGSSRSGTTWLAKIVDSHPDILYRHEPDEATPVRSHPAGQLRIWAQQRGLRVAAKRPWFRKSWRPWPMELAWRASASGLALALRFVGPLVPAVPDLVGLQSRPRVRLAMKVVGWDGAAAAAALPGTRTLYILRHPCGQVASVMAGRREGRFGSGAMPNVSQAAARAYAAGFGIDAAAFDRAADCVKEAWFWRAFNEPAVQALEALPNARVVVYEDMCRDPVGIGRDLFQFLGLFWQAQTAAFLSASTQHDGPSGYFGVFRSAQAAAERWRRTMPAETQAAVLDVVRSSPLARYWPDLGQR